MKFIIFTLTLLLSISCYSQQTALNPISWKASYIKTSAREGEIQITANIEKNWHIYSQRPTDAGPIPTSFTVTPHSNFTLIGKVDETNAHEEFVKAFDAKIFVFEKEAVFTQKITCLTKSPFDIMIQLEYMTCNDMQCLPPKTIKLQVTINP
jgi:thiol:disulfide interchange protein DsbD